MKKLLLIFLVMSLAFMISGCSLLDTICPEPDPVLPTDFLSADIEIINWVQEEGEILLTYEIKNTGEVEIAYYKVLFEVTYADGSSYIIWHEKAGILFAGTEVVEIVVDVSDEVARVDIMDLKLTEWKFY